MKVVIAHRTGQPRVVDLPEPKYGADYIAVRVSHSAVVLPDELHALESAPSRVKPGQDGVPLGSCASGTILAVGGNVKTLKTGLRVAVTGAPYVYHAGMLVVPENLAVELPKKVNHEEGSYVGLGAAALHMMRTGDIRLGEVVMIFGADMLGILAAQVVRAAGATPVLVDESDFRLTKAKALGIHHIYSPRDEALVTAIDQMTQGYGVDCSILTRKGRVEDYELAAALLRHGGKMVLGSALGASVPVDILREKEVALLSAVGGGAGSGDRDFEVMSAGYPRSLARWTERDNMGCFSNLLAERKVQIAPLITDRIPAERAPTLYEKAGRGRDSVLGVVLTL